MGLVERIGEETSRLQHTPLHRRRRGPASGRPIADHEAALKAVAEELAADGLGLDSPELAAIGHRVVHGGLRFTEPTVIDDEVLAEIERLIPVAPLHNPANITGIRTAQALRPDLPQVAVFDTAFHTTMPESRGPLRDRRGDRRRAPASAATASTAPRTRTSRGRRPQLLGKDPAEVNVDRAAPGQRRVAPRRCAAAGAWTPPWG